MKNQENYIAFISILFILLWSYAAFSKLAELEKSHSEMLNQVFPIGMANILYWFIPVLELGICTLLIFTATRTLGIYASLILISSFTLYIAIVMTGVFGRVPCSCGGIIGKITYGWHLLFNSFFVVLALWGESIVRRRTTFGIFKLVQRKEVIGHSE